MSKPIATPYRTKQLLQKHGLSLKKSLGQNFLIDANVLRNLVRHLDVKPDTGVVEIGPGIGALTEPLAELAEKVVTVEIDGRLIPVLQEVCNSYNNVRVVHADILKLNVRELASEFRPGQDLIAAANLPYYITTPILMKLLHGGLTFRSIVVMMQKEVAKRITASPGEKDYGSLSIAVQYYARTQVVMNVPKTAFMPNPGVDSAVLHLAIRPEPVTAVGNEEFFFQVVRACFGQRRKTIFNNLTRFFSGLEKATIRNDLQTAGLDPTRRAETLSIDEFAHLSDTLLPLSDKK